MALTPIRYRDEVRAKYPEHVAACEALETFVVANRPSTPPRDAVEDAIVKTYATSSKSFMGSTLLAGHGYGEQAGMVNTQRRGGQGAFAPFAGFGPFRHLFPF
jgi:hypothetical protein